MCSAELVRIKIMFKNPLGQLNLNHIQGKDPFDDR